MNDWQKQWDEGGEGCHLYQLKQKVGGMKTIELNTRQYIKVKNRTNRIKKNNAPIGKHPSGQCECGLGEETVEHVICHCQKYNTERQTTEGAEKMWGGRVKPEEFNIG